VFRIDAVFYFILEKRPNIRENSIVKNKKTLLGAVQILSVCLLMSFSAYAESGDKRPRGEAAQKIAKLKSELNEAKGQKRVKLIKKIAEMENKILENRMQSFK